MNEYAVVIPVFGEHDFTNNLIDDLDSERSFIDVYLVDNQGGYARTTTKMPTTVLKPGSNLGWAAGSNYGVLEARRVHDYKGYFLMNNDVRVSTNFCREMVASSDYMPLCGLLGPMYDDVWPQQRNGFTGDAWRYRVNPNIHEVEFIDGTCMYVPGDVLKNVGLLDTENFGATGWGADFDYALRVKAAGYKVYATERSYLNHHRKTTARRVYGDDYEALGGVDLNTGMTVKYGDNWKELLGL